VRDFRLDAAYTDLNWTQLLLPAYVSWYEEGEEIWPVLVNGQTGRVSGVRRASARKARTTALVLGGIGVLLFLVGGLLALLGGVFPPLIAVGLVILILGVVLGLAAPVPPIAVWRFNRGKRSGTRDGSETS
jgi:fatty acid desaturase